MTIIEQCDLNNAALFQKIHGDIINRYEPTENSQIVTIKFNNKTYVQVWCNANCKHIQEV